MKMLLKSKLTLALAWYRKIYGKRWPYICLTIVRLYPVGIVPSLTVTKKSKKTKLNLISACYTGWVSGTFFFLQFPLIFPGKKVSQNG